MVKVAAACTRAGWQVVHPLAISGANGRVRPARAAEAAIIGLYFMPHEAGGTGIMHVTGKTTLIRIFSTALTIAALSLPGTSLAAGSSAQPELDPPQGSRQDMMGDLVLQRPFGLANTVVGIGTWIVSLPFTIFSGSTGNAGEVLVVQPAANTFTRPLGYPAPVGRPDK